jgi:exopolysaccharide production protein ExoQ
MLAGMLWLFRLADSATSLVCFMLGSAILVALHSKTLKLEQQPIGLLIVSGVIMLGLMQLIFGLSDLVIGAVGRETTLTGRTALWADVLGMVQSPLFGTGFESFWVGPEAQVLWDKYWWHPNQAHNGYLETYINLGIVGVGLLAIVLFATYRSARAAYARATPMASLWLAYLFVIIVYNWTEASFKALHLLFFVFFLISVRYIQPVSSEIQVEEEVPSWDRRQRRLAARRPVAARRPKGVPRWDEPVAVDPLSK